MPKLAHLIVKPIESVNKFTPEHNFFYRKAYLSKSNKTEDFVYYPQGSFNPIYISKKAPSLVLSDVKTDDTIGIFESYWPMVYGVTKEQTLKLGDAFEKVSHSKNKWSAAFTAVDLLHKYYLEIQKDEHFEDFPDRSDAIIVTFRSKEHTECFCSIDFGRDSIKVYTEVTPKDEDDHDRWKSEEYHEFTTMKKAFLLIVDTFENAGYDPNKIDVSIESEYDDFSNDLLSLSSWVSLYHNVPFSAVKAYKSLYEKNFPKIKFPSAYLFYAENNFGTKGSQVYVAKNKSDAYQDFLKDNKIDISVEKTSYNTNVWKLCAEQEGVKQW